MLLLFDSNTYKNIKLNLTNKDLIDEINALMIYYNI